MKNPLFFLILAAAMTIPSLPAMSWQREGHETIAKLAEINLRKGTKKKIEKYLGGHSIVYEAKWMDLVRKTPQFNFLDKWHTATVDMAGNYYPDTKRGDVIIGLEQALETLKDYKNLPDSVVALNIRYIIHLVGDMHCPSHVYYKEHGQKFKVKLENDSHVVHEYAFHMLWDAGLIQSYRFMCATEWANELNQVLSKADKKAIAAGTPRDWLKETALKCSCQFDLAPEGARLSSDFVMKAMPMVETQITNAGIRLASVLNGIFK